MDIPVANEVAGAEPADFVDAERRFGGLERLYGPEALRRLMGATVAVAGISGVGLWRVEALPRSGVGLLTMLVMDPVGETNKTSTFPLPLQPLSKHHMQAKRAGRAGTTTP